MPETETQNHVITIAVVDDDANVRSGLWWLLNNVTGMRCTGVYASCADFLGSSADAIPDILLLDVSMPNVSGIDGLPLIRAKFSATKVVMHSNFDDDDKILRSRQAGASGFILKNASAPQLYDMLVKVHAGASIWPAGFATPPVSKTSVSLLKSLSRKFRSL